MFARAILCGYKFQTETVVTFKKEHIFHIQIYHIYQEARPSCRVF